MHRVGAEPDDLVGLADVVAEAGPLRLGALWTHLAVAEATGPTIVDFTERQLERFEAVVERHGRCRTPAPLTHVANSAGAIAYPGSRRDLVRCGIAVYGVAPTPALADTLAEASGGERCARCSPFARGSRTCAISRPASVLPTAAGVPFRRAATVATAPIGYADGVPRRLFDEGGEVLIGGRAARWPASSPWTRS